MDIHLRALVISLALFCHCKAQNDERPNIILIYTDDLGFNDLGFTGSPQAQTPNIDALARDGTVIFRHYAQDSCTPSRGALLTGKYPIHIGLQEGVLNDKEPAGLPLEHTIMPQFFKDLGYETHCIGKWHLGFFEYEYLPVMRGFDDFYGFYTSGIDYYLHTDTSNVDALDFHYDTAEPFNLTWDDSQYGNYSTYIFEWKTEDMIRARSDKPFFLYLAHQAPHSPLQGDPDLLDEDILDSDRMQYLSMINALDVTIGDLVSVLTEEGILDNTIIVFAGDNGGTVRYSASNYPLRAHKSYLFDGGVRTAGFITGPGVKSEFTYKSLFHVSDWLPTLYAAAGGDVADLGEIDGYDHWASLSDGGRGPRSELLLNINTWWHQAALIKDNYKLMFAKDGFVDAQGKLTVYDQWYHYEGPYGETDTERNTMIGDWELPLVECGNSGVTECDLNSQQYCLFNILNDPCEYNDLSEKRRFQDTLNEMIELLEQYNQTVVEAVKTDQDRNAHPRNFDMLWVPWMSEPYASM